MTRKLLLCLFLLVPSCVLSTESECEETMRDYMTLYAKDIIREEIRNIGNLATIPSATISTQDVVAAATSIINDVVVPQMAQKIKESVMEEFENVVKEQVNTRVQELMPSLEANILRNLQQSQSEEVAKTEALTDLEERVEKVEELGKLNMVRHCQDLADQGVKKNGFYYGDPDGNGIGEEPLQMECEFSTNTTKIHHNLGEDVEIDRCDEPGCAKYDLVYGGSLKQIKTLIGISQECTQDIKFDCHMAPLKQYEENLGWWRDVEGVSRYFFNGNNVSFF